MDKTNYILDKVSQIECELQLQAKINKDTQEKFETNDENINQLETTTSTLTETTTKLESDISTLSTDTKSNLSKIQELEGELNSTNSTINKLSTKLDNNVNNLSNQISSEITTRQNADTNLQKQINGKQAKLSTAQQNAVNSGITSDLVTQIGTNKTNIATNTTEIAKKVNSSQIVQATGTSTIDIMSQCAVTTQLNNKVDKISGKGLSTNDFTTAYKNQIDTNKTNIATNTTNIAKKLEASNIKAGSNITVSTSGNNVTINAETGEGGTNVYVNNVKQDSISFTSDPQTQINSKQATITGGATTITSSNLTASRALISNSSGKVAVSDITSTELGYLDGVTSNIQTQISAKVNSSQIVQATGTSTTNLMSQNAVTTQLGNKADCDASNLSDTNVTSWQNKLITNAIAGNGIGIKNGVISSKITRTKVWEGSLGGGYNKTLSIDLSSYDEVEIVDNLATVSRLTLNTGQGFPEICGSKSQYYNNDWHSFNFQYNYYKAGKQFAINSEYLYIKQIWGIKYED